MGKSISYQRPDGESVNGYLAEGARGGPAPGIVVIQEWWGLNDQIRGSPTSWRRRDSVPWCRIFIAAKSRSRPRKPNIS